MPDAINGMLVLVVVAFIRVPIASNGWALK